MVLRRIVERSRQLWIFWSMAMLFVLGVGYLKAQGLAADGASYRLVEGWPQTPSGQQMGFASWIGVDAEGVVYVFRRCPAGCSDGGHPGEGDPPGNVWMFNRSGKFMGEWPQGPSGIAKEAHGLHVDRDGFVWTTDVQRHDVKKSRADGTLVMTLGTTGVSGQGRDTFNKPTHVFVGSSGDVFVTDGYGNQRVVKLNHDGQFVRAWGTKGTDSGQFRLPHSVAQDSRGHVFVADRCGLGATGCNDGRVQIFDDDGGFLDQWTPPGGGPFTPMAVDIDNDDRLYIGDSQNRKIWIVEARTGNVLGTVENAQVHGMSVSSTGDDIYVSSGNGARRYTRDRTR
jgi:hypothetical protein